MIKKSNEQKSSSHGSGWMKRSGGMAPGERYESAKYELIVLQSLSKQQAGAPPGLESELHASSYRIYSILVGMASTSQR